VKNDQRGRATSESALSQLPVETPELVNRVMKGDTAALSTLFAIHRPRLWRMINFRLDSRLTGRLDADDILQEAWMRAVDRIDSFIYDASRSTLIWFRMIVTQTMVDLHRRHLGAEKRSAAKEISIHGGWSADSTSFSLARHLLGHLSSPSAALMRAELSKQLETALQTMSEIDREVLALRHFEELTNSETAMVLEMSEQAASARYVRALARLRHVLEAIPGLLDTPDGE
jgi:RNA polymerase sigma-70 factor, ECF subfamily